MSNLLSGGLRRLALLSAMTLAVVALCGCSDTVPDVTGMSPADAAAAIEKAGLTVGRRSFVSSSQAKLGTVAAQDPEPGSLSQDGLPVSIAIAVRDGQQVVVPPLVGLNIEEARKVEKATGGAVTVAKGLSDVITPGFVAEQRPEAGEKISAGDPILIVESTGPSKVRLEVPEVIGRSQDEARQTLRDEGFRTETVEVFDPNMGRGLVITQVPRGGALRLPGSVVHIIIAAKKQRGMTSVPSSMGLSTEQATEAAASAGLKVKVLKRNSASFARGLVIEQVPAAGTPVPRGTTIVLMASIGRARGHVVVPDVLGLEYDDAVAELEAAGLKPLAWPVKPEPGYVIREQFPQAGNSATRGNRVVIVP